MSNFLDSNRWKHFLIAIPCGFIGTVLFATGLAAGMEFKDRQYSNKWDWLDFWFTVLGGLVGNILLVAVIFIIILTNK